MSLIKEEKLQPIQHFNMHDDPLTNIETLHLLIWDQGICIAGYGMNKNVLTTKVYVFPKSNSHALESIFINEPLVAGPQPVTHIWIAESRNMVIPQQLFNETAAASWLRKFHHITPDESIYSTTLQHPTAAGITYPVSNNLINLLKKFFIEGKIEALSAAILQTESVTEHDTADIVFLNETVALTIRKKGKLVAHQIGLMEDINNLVYKIASICQEHLIAQEELKVSISGFCIQENLTNELKAFYPKMVIPGSEQFSSFTLLSKLITCAL